MVKPEKKAAKENLTELNILPRRYRRKRIQLHRILPWLLLVILLVLLYPLGSSLLEAQQLYLEAKTDFQELQTAVDEYTPLLAEVESLEGEIKLAREQAEEVRSRYSNFAAASTEFGKLLALALDQISADERLTNIFLEGQQITLIGTSEAYQTPLDLADRLAALDAFPEVSLERIALLEAEGFPAATPAGETSPPPSGPRYYFQINIATGKEEKQP